MEGKKALNNIEAKKRKRRKEDHSKRSKEKSEMETETNYLSLNIMNMLYLKGTK